MSEFNVVKLSGNLEVQIDLEKVRETLKKRKDIKRILKLQAGDDAYDEWIASITGLPFEAVVDMDREDFLALDKAIGRAVRTVMGVNPN